MWEDYKARAYDILNIKDPDDPLTELFNYFLIILIVLNIAAFFAMTFESIEARYALFFTLLETFSVAVFTIEYFLRLWVSDLDPRYKGQLKGRLTYALTNVLAVSDLLAILPFYLPMVGSFDLIFLRALRLFRLFRIFKLARYSSSMDILERVIIRQKEYLVLTFAIVFVLLLISSGIMYYLEHDAQPQKFATIFDAMLWDLKAMTGAGSVDIYPITPEGRLLGAILSFVGIIVAALPIGVIVAGLGIEMGNERRAEKINMIRRAIKPDKPDDKQR
jgi:voltage-gated potassium channel